MMAHWKEMVRLQQQVWKEIWRIFFSAELKTMNFCAHSYLMESRLFGE
jgi:hypothetical protein